MYYYFIMQGSKPISIKVTPLRKNTAIMTMYREMSNEQREFYLANPTASVQEVWNCQLIPPYVPHTPDVQEYAAQKIKELKEACYAAVEVSDLEFAMAIDKVENPTASCYYNLPDAQRVVSSFRSQSKAAMQVYDTYRPQIEAASTIDAIDTLFNTAIEAL